MIHRYPVHLTTVEEDFKAIGIIPETQLVESHDQHGNLLTELDNSQNPRDISSPDPSTLGGNDDSGSSIETRARHATGRQPRPRISPDERNDHDDPLSAGATQRGRSAGKYSKAPNYREDYDDHEGDEYEEGYEEGPDPSHGYSQYKILAKNIGMDGASDKGKKPDRAEGNAKTKKIAGMSERAGMGRAADILSEVDALVRGAQTDENIDNLIRGFSLLGENAALLADRLVEISESFEVGHVVSAMESLSHNAIDALDILEATVSFQKDKKQAIKNGEYKVEDDEDVLEDIALVFQEMTLDLMDAVESYDVVLEQISEAYYGEGEDDDDDSDDDDSDNDDDDDDDDEKKSVKKKMESMRRMYGGRGNV